MLKQIANCQLGLLSGAPNLSGSGPVSSGGGLVSGLAGGGGLVSGLASGGGLASGLAGGGGSPGLLSGATNGVTSALGSLTSPGNQISSQGSGLNQLLGGDGTILGLNLGSLLDLNKLVDKLIAPLCTTLKPNFINLSVLANERNCSSVVVPNFNTIAEYCAWYNQLPLWKQKCVGDAVIHFSSAPAESLIINLLLIRCCNIPNRCRCPGKFSFSSIYLMNSQLMINICHSRR